MKHHLRRIERVEDGAAVKIARRPKPQKRFWEPQELVAVDLDENEDELIWFALYAYLRYAETKQGGEL